MQALGELVRQTPWLQSPSHLTFLHTSLSIIPRSPPPNTAQPGVWSGRLETTQNSTKTDLRSTTVPPEERVGLGHPMPPGGAGYAVTAYALKPDIYAAVPGLGLVCSWIQTIICALTISV